MSAPASRFEHLMRLTDHHGTFEHASGAVPDPAHGYCTDDMARVLVIATRETEPNRDANRLAGVAVRFLNDAQSHAGTCRNRMNRNGNWEDQPTAQDCWGRCLWGLGTAAVNSDVGLVRRLAVIQFERSAKIRSPWPRSMAFAALGAAEILSAHPDHRLARSLITDYADSVAEASRDAAWPWPEPRLTYANAVLPEAMIAAGATLDRPELTRRGLHLLEWLLDYETGDGHLSPTPVGGRGPDDVKPGFDQQPIEISTLADACARAAGVDASPTWPNGVRAAAAWFHGDNDAGETMWDSHSGGGYDGLHADGVNRNQGAESTLALISTLQQAQRFSTVTQ